MKYFMSLHIHSNFASYSSEDTFLYMEFKGITSSRPAKTFIKHILNQFQHLKQNETTTSKIDDVMIFYIEDETFYKLSLKNKKVFDGYKDTPEFKKLVDEYKEYCFVEDKPEGLRKYYINDRKREYTKRKNNGYVYHFEYEDYSPNKIQGGLSDEIMNHSEVKSYIERYPFGYIGHSVRKPNIDKYIETQFMKLNRPVYEDVPSLKDLFALWLTSSDGRHFGDSLEGYSFKDQKIQVQKHLPYMYNCAFVWHTKESGSTSDLMEKYKHRLIKENVL